MGKTTLKNLQAMLTNHIISKDACEDYVSNFFSHIDLHASTLALEKVAYLPVNLDMMPTDV